MCMCGKCSKMSGSVVLIAGLLLLLKNIGVWTFWGIDGWTVAFILAGFAMMAKSCCKDCCNGMCKMPEAKTSAAPKAKKK